MVDSISSLFAKIIGTAPIAPRKWYLGASIKVDAFIGNRLLTLKVFQD